MTKANSDESIMIILHQRSPDRREFCSGLEGKESCPSGGLPKNWGSRPLR